MYIKSTCLKQKQQTKKVTRAGQNSKHNATPPPPTVFGECLKNNGHHQLRLFEGFQITFTNKNLKSLPVKRQSNTASANVEGKSI